MDMIEMMMPAIRPMLENIEIQVFGVELETGQIGITIKNNETGKCIGIKKEMPIVMTLADLVNELENMQ